MNHDDYLKEVDSFGKRLREDPQGTVEEAVQAGNYIRYLLGRVEAAEMTVKGLVERIHRHGLKVHANEAYRRGKRDALEGRKE